MTNASEASRLRNLLNVKSLKQEILERNADRAPSIQAWLKKPFIRYIQNAFDPFQTVTSLKDLAALDLGTPEQWLLDKLELGETFIYIDPNHPDLLAQEASCIEWLSSRLGTRDEPKFQRMTAEQILDKQRATHDQLAAKAQKGFRSTTGGALRLVTTVGELTCYELVAGHPEFRQELMNETVMVQHCVGLFEDRTALSGGVGEHYARGAEEGEMRLFSLRTQSGNARMTMSVLVQDGAARLEQLKGKQNRPPTIQYHEAALASLRALDITPEDSFDVNAVGIIVQGKDFVSLFEQSAETIDQYLRRFPELIMGIPDPTPAQLWATIPRNFELAKGFALPAALEMLIAMSDPFVARKLKGFSPVHRDIGLGRAMIKRNQTTAILPNISGLRR